MSGKDFRTCKPTRVKAFEVPHMRISIRQFVLMLAAALAAFGLSGCGTINERITPGVVDAIPQWAGGLPSGVPPRPGTAGYDEYMKEQERKRLEPAPPKDAAANASMPSTGSSGLDPVH
jgi:hypothetical protein